MKIRKVFTGGNTANGFHSFHNYIIPQNRRKLYIIKGMPGGGKSSLMREIGQRMSAKGFSIEYHHCPSDPKSIDAVVIEELNICLLDGTPPHSMDPTYPGLTDKIIDLAQFIDSERIKSKEGDIKRAKLNNKYAYERAFNYFKAARLIHDQIVNENKRNLDIKSINKESKRLLEMIFSKDEKEIVINGFKERHLFSTANTPEGYFDYTNTILEWVEDIYFIKGEIGTGKSTLLYRILEEAKLRNYHVEIYHNSLIPGKLESLYIKELDTIITSNNHGKERAKYTLNLNNFFDNSKLNKEDYKIFNLLVDKGIKSLSGAKENHFILEKSYRPCIDYLQIDKLREEIYEEILAFID